MSAPLSVAGTGASGVSGLVDSIRQHKNFKRLAGYAIQCLEKVRPGFSCIPVIFCDARLFMLGFSLFILILARNVRYPLACTARFAATCLAIPAPFRFRFHKFTFFIVLFILFCPVLAYYA